MKYFILSLLLVLQCCFVYAQETGPADSIMRTPSTGGKARMGSIDLTKSAAVGVSILGIINGGTNSNTALSNNRLMTSSGGSIVEAAAITASKALVSNGSGIPVASATTDTELGYVSGVTSAIQTQLNTKGDASTNTATSVDGEIALFSGAGGKTIKRATGTGIAHVTSGVLSASNVNLTSEVTGILPNANTTATNISNPSTIVARDLSGNFFAGTITAALTGTASGNTTLSPLDHAVVVSRGTNILNTTAVGLTNTVLHGNTGADPTFSTVSLTADVSGALPVANGGTNSSTTLNNNRVMQSSGGSIVEAAAITASRALASDANGIPTQSATTATELGYVSGVTSAIQTQITNLVPIFGKIYYVSTTGNDSNIGYSINKPFLTLSAALTAAGNVGNQVCVLPGTYAGNYTVSNQNVTITSANNEAGGLVNFTGTLTVSNVASSVRLNNLIVDTINHTGAGSLYITNSQIATALTSSSSGYLEVMDSDTQGTGLAGTIGITGTGTKVFIGSNKVGSMTVNNASVSVNISNALTITPMTLSAGSVGIDNSVIYAATGTSNAITVTGASSLLVLNNLTALTPTNTPARISIAAASFYNIRTAYIDKTNSTLSGTVLATATTADLITSAIFSSDSFTASRALATNASKQIVVSATTSAELAFVNGVTSAIQTQLNNKQGLDATLTSLAAYNTNGLLTQTAADTFTGRTITAGSTKISMSNGDGVSGNPTVDVTEANLTLNNIGGTLGISKGGTGQTTKAPAFDALSPMTTKGDLIGFSTLGVRLPVGSDTQVLSADSTAATGLKWVAAGTGDVTSNTATSVDSEIALFSSTTGKVIKRATGTGVAHVTSGVFSASNVDLTSEVTGVLPIANGGTNSTATPTAGGIGYGTGTAHAYTAADTTGRAVVSGGTGAPTWFAPTAGSVLFAGTSGILQQDNSGLFYDDSNNRLGVNTASPNVTLNAVKTSAGANTIVASFDNASNTLNTSAMITLGPTASPSTQYAAIAGFNDGGASNTIGLRFYGSNGTTPAETMRIASNGRVSIFTMINDTQNTLTYNTSTGLLSYTVSSERYKKNITDLDKQVDTSKIYDLRPVFYSEKQSGSHMAGLIAEEVEKVFPEFIIYSYVDKDGKTQMVPQAARDKLATGITLTPADYPGLHVAPETVRYDSVFTAMLAEMQKMKTHVDELEQRVKILEAKK